MMELDALLAALGRLRPGGAGVRDFSVHASETRRFALGIKDRETGNAHAPASLAETAGAQYLLVWDDGRISRGSWERRQVEQDVERALADARSAAYDDPDAAQVLGPAEFPAVALYDEDAARAAGGDDATLAERLAAVRAVVDEHGLRTWSGSFSAAAGSSRLVTSAGLDVEGRGTTVGWHVSVNGELGDGHGARRAEPERDFRSRLDRLVGLAAELERDAAPRPGGIEPVLLHPRVVESYVLDTLFDNLDGSTVAHGQGHFRREQFGAGAPVLREDLRLLVDPLEPLRLGSYRYTSEGLPARRSAFIDGGRLVSPVLDLKYARRLGMAPTPQPYAMDAVRLEGPPTLALADALAQADGGTLVLTVLGVHTQDPASGDFSLSAPQSLRIAAGGFAGRVRATLSGNLFELLRAPSLALVDFEGETTPGLLVDCRLDPK